MNVFFQNSSCHNGQWNPLIQKHKAITLFEVRLKVLHSQQIAVGMRPPATVHLAHHHIPPTYRDHRCTSRPCLPAKINVNKPYHLKYGYPFCCERVTAMASSATAAAATVKRCWVRRCRASPAPLVNMFGKWGQARRMRIFVWISGWASAALAYGYGGEGGNN